jgi:hypothetical protein
VLQRVLLVGQDAECDHDDVDVPPAKASETTRLTLCGSRASNVAVLTSATPRPRTRLAAQSRPAERRAASTARRNRPSPASLASVAAAMSDVAPRTSTDCGAPSASRLAPAPQVIDPLTGSIAPSELSWRMSSTMPPAFWAASP